MQLFETLNLKNHDHLSKTHCTTSGMRSCITWQFLGVSLQFVTVVSEVKKSYCTADSNNFRRNASLFRMN